MPAASPLSFPLPSIAFSLLSSVCFLFAYFVVVHPTFDSFVLFSVSVPAPASVVHRRRHGLGQGVQPSIVWRETYPPGGKGDLQGFRPRYLGSPDRGKHVWTHSRIWDTGAAAARVLSREPNAKDNLFEWHFVVKVGHGDFQGGMYHGRILVRAAVLLARQDADVLLTFVTRGPISYLQNIL
jgi:hypothetical protein